MNTKKFFVAVFFSVFAFFAMSHASVASAATTDNVFGTAWSDGTGWISFNNCTDPSTCSGPSYGVNMDSTTGNLSGEAWSDNLGWISFNNDSTTGCTTQPNINLSTGAFSGFAWVESAGTGYSNGGWDGCISIGAGSGGPGWQVSTTTGIVTGAAWSDLNTEWIVPTSSGPGTMKIIAPPFSGGLTPSLTISTWGVTNPQGPGVTYNGSPYTLTWPAVANATFCTLDGTSVSPNGGSVNGSASGWTNNTHDFVLSCSGAGTTGTSTVSNISYPPAPSNVALACNAQGNQLTVTWTAPSGYNTFYTRLQDSNGVEVDHDTVTGTSDTFSGSPGLSYTSWVHTRDPGDNGWSAPVYSSTVACTSPSHIITASQGSNGAISPAGATTVVDSGSQTYSISPSLGYHIVSVIVDGTPAGTAGSYTFSNVQADHTITGTFGLPAGCTAPTYTITTSTTGGATITPASGTNTVLCNDTPTYTITPPPGSTITSVCVNGVCSSPTNTITLPPVTGDQTITVTSSPNTPGGPFIIGASAGPDGTVTPSGLTTVVSGGSQTYTITPDSGYTIATVTIDGQSVSVGSSHTFSNVVSNHTINATFTSCGGSCAPLSPHTGNPSGSSTGIIYVEH